jgi:hypothetical protein
LKKNLGTPRDRNKKFEKKIIVEIWNENFYFWNLKKSGHATRGNWKNNWNISFIPPIKNWNEKILYLKWNALFLKFEKKMPYHERETKKFQNEEIIYFVYAIGKKLPIIPLYHLWIPLNLYHTSKLGWYTMNLTCGILSY